MLFCNNCQQQTITSEPVFLRRIDLAQVHVTGVCAVCGDTKAKYLSPVEIRMLPQSFKQMTYKRTFLKYVKIDDKQIELYPVLEPILNRA